MSYVHPKIRWNHDAPSFHGPRVSREGAEARRRRDKIRNSSLLRALVPSCETFEQLPRSATDFLDARTSTSAVNPLPWALFTCRRDSGPTLPISHAPIKKPGNSES